MIKVIHVHLLFEKKDYYFGSISAIFSIIDECTLGISKSYLLHAKLENNSHITTSRAIIRQSYLIRGGNNK